MNERTRRLFVALAEVPDWLTETDDRTEEECRTVDAPHDLAGGVTVLRSSPTGRLDGTGP